MRFDEAGGLGGDVQYFPEGMKGNQAASEDVKLLIGLQTHLPMSELLQDFDHSQEVLTESTIFPFASSSC